MATFTGTSASENIEPDDIDSSVSHPFLAGLGGSDALFGEAGNDTLDGGDNADFVDGGEDDDVLKVGAGDLVYGDSGSDHFVLLAEAPLLDGGSSDDTLWVVGDWSIANLSVTSIEHLNFQLGELSYASDWGLDDDVGIDWTSNALTLTMQQLAGFESIDVGIRFQESSITLVTSGAATPDVSGNGLLTITCAAGANDLDLASAVGGASIKIIGNDGDDVYLTGDGLDTIIGGEGHDTLDGGGRSQVTLAGDSLDGGDGDDVIAVRTYDTALGGDGEDRLEVVSGLSILSGTVIDGGGDYDELYVLGTASLGAASIAGVEALMLGSGTVSLSATQLGSFSEIGMGGTDQVGLIEMTSSGSIGTLSVSGLNRLEVSRQLGVTSISVVFNTPGVDIDITGGSGDDVIVTGEGDDTINGQTGTDNLSGRGGDDLIIVGDGATPVVLSGGTGTDVLQVGGDVDLTRPQSGGFDETQVIDMETLDLSYGATLVLTTNQLASFDTVEVSFIFGFAHLELIDGGTVNIDVAGVGGLDVTGTGDDSTLAFTARNANIEVAAGGGGDTVSTGGGRDVLEGGSGNDSLSGSDGRDLLLGGGDADTLNGNSHADTLDGGTGNNKLYGGLGDDTLIGGADNDTLDGGDGNDTASYAQAAAGVTADLGVPGSDNTGGGGLDLHVSIENLTGSAFADTLTGDGGANVLSGLDGDDILTGAAGVDTFVFKAGSGVDTVLDFADGEDKLSFIGFGFSDPADIISLAAQDGADTVILFDPPGGALSMVTLVGFQLANLDVSDFGSVIA
jgi:Ca2+-binding RTX toxin-like protein